MAMAKTGSSHGRLLPNGMATALNRGINQFLGVLLIIVSGAGWICLYSWSIDDPSFNHATSEAPRNVLGPIGADLADLMFQFTGLAAIAIFFPPAIWGLMLLSGRRHFGIRLRLLLWPFAVVLFAGALSALTPPKAWPLSVDLGGMSGEAVFGVAARIIGHLIPTWDAFLAGPMLAAFGIFFLIRAAGLRYEDVKLLWRFECAAPTQRICELLVSLFYAFFHIRVRILDASNTSPGHFRLRNVLGSLKALEKQSIVDVAPPVGTTLHKTATSDPLGRIEPYFDDNGPMPPGPSINPNALLKEFGPVGAPDDLCDQPEPHSVFSADAQESQSIVANKHYRPPHMRLLKKPEHAARNSKQAPETLREQARTLEDVLQDFGVSGEIGNIRSGPVVTLFELEPARGTKSARVIGLADDIARSMSAISTRVAVIPGQNAIGIELPNDVRETVFLREIFASRAFAASESQLPLALGKTIDGEPVIVDLARMPHLLVAGTTGSGKSVSINAMILSLLFRLSPEQCRFIMIDPKMLELSVYDGIPHLLTPVVTEPSKAVAALKWTVREMEERYKLMSKLGVRNIDGYNERIRGATKNGEDLSRTIQTGFDRETGQAIYEREVLDLQPLPFIVVIVDEMADLMIVAGKDIEAAVQRLAQMARAAGIHLIAATQRPSVDVITGTIKANFPTRISFQVTSKVDSRTILGEQGAEQLLGAGDMLYLAGGGKPVRVHGPFVSDDEIERIAKFLKSQGEPQYVNEVTEPLENEDGNGHALSEAGRTSGNDLYDRAVEIVLRDGRVSTSYIQRKLSIGYNRAATLVERMEEEALISAADHVGRRTVLVDRPERAVSNSGF
ncbi:MAG: DNA translocase FtsK 4TM domain-containing protein [Methyloligellaceae bacterium]